MINCNIQVFGRNNKHIAEQLKEVIKQIENDVDNDSNLEEIEPNEPMGYQYSIEGIEE